MALKGFVELKNINKKRIVVKLGGSALDQPETLKQLAILVKGYQDRNYDVVVVHGGGPAINQELVKRNISWKFIDGQRQTTPEMMNVIEKVLGGEVNQKVVGSLRANQIPAVGLSGGQDRILICVPSADSRLMRVGTVDSVNTHAIEVVLKYSGGNVVPVIAPIGVGSYGDKFNVNADWAATQIATALKAEKLVFLTDQFGILNADQELIKVAAPRLLERMMLEGVIYGGMSTKVRAMVRAIKLGIKQVQVLHAATASLLLEDETTGTVIMNVPAAVRPKPKEVLHGRSRAERNTRAS